MKSVTINLIAVGLVGLVFIGLLYFLGVSAESIFNGVSQ